VWIFKRRREKDGMPQRGKSIAEQHTSKSSGKHSKTGE